MLDWVLNTLIILPSNVIWYVYRLIAETKISGLVCLSYVFFMLRRNRMAKKYNIERYNTLELSGIFTINDQFS